MTINSASPAALAQPQPISQQLPTTQGEWTQFSTTLNLWLQYLQGPQVPFTPTIAATSGTPTYTLQSGLYSKSGNWVTFTARVDISALGGLSGAVSLNALPVLSSSLATGGTVLPCYASGVTPLGNDFVVLGFVPAASNVVTFVCTGTGAATFLQASQLTAPCIFIVSGTYPI